MSQEPDENEDLRGALEWFYQSVPDRRALLERIRTAQRYYAEHSMCRGLHWPQSSSAVLQSDLAASYLAQADAHLHSRRHYDLALGARIVPFIKMIGRSVEILRKMPGAADRASRMLVDNNEHPEGGLFELVTAARYVREGFDVAFIEATRFCRSQLAAFRYREIASGRRQTRNPRVDARHARLVRSFWHAPQLAGRVRQARHWGCCMSFISKPERRNVIRIACRADNSRAQRRAGFSPPLASGMEMEMEMGMGMGMAGRDPHYVDRKLPTGGA